MDNTGDCIDMSDGPIIDFVSDFYGVSGYGNAARSSLRAMLDAGLNVRPKLNAHDSNTTVFDEYWEDGRKLRNLVEKCSSDNRPPDVRIWCQTPNWFNRPPNEEGVYNIGWTLWETSKIIDFDLGGDKRNNWVHQLNGCDEVWTSCWSSKEVFADCGVTQDIHVIGHPRDWDMFKKRKVCDRFWSDRNYDKAFKFLSVSQWTPRKGFKDLIISYLCEFNDKDNVNLILKTYVNNFKDKKQILDEINLYKSGLNRHNGGFPKISLLFKNIPQSDMPKMYNMCDCFILPTLGEGMGLPLMEAMGSEMLCITPNHTAMRDYVSDTNCIVLRDWREECAHGMGGMHVYQSDQYWYRSNMSEIRGAMRRAYEMDNKERSAYGRAARNTVTKNYSYGVLGQKMRDLILQREVKATEDISPSNQVR